MAFAETNSLQNTLNLNQTFFRTQLINRLPSLLNENPLPLTTVIILPVELSEIPFKSMERCSCIVESRIIKVVIA